MSNPRAPKLKSLNLIALLSRLSLGGMRVQAEHGHARYQRQLVVYPQTIRHDDWRRAVQASYVEPDVAGLWKLSEAGKQALLITVQASQNMREYALRARGAVE